MWEDKLFWRENLCRKAISGQTLNICPGAFYKLTSKHTSLSFSLLSQMILVSGSKFLWSKRFSSIFPSKSLDLDGDTEAWVPVAPITLSETAEDFTKGPIPFRKGVLPEQWTKERKPWFCLWFCSSTVLTYCFPFILKHFLIPADSGPHYWKKETKPPDACYFVDTLMKWFITQWNSSSLCLKKNNLLGPPTAVNFQLNSYGSLSFKLHLPSQYETNERVCFCHLHCS